MQNESKIHKTFETVSFRHQSLLTTREAAELLNLKESTLEQWRWKGCGPLFIKLGRSVRYRLVDVENFTAEHAFTSTTTAQQNFLL